MSPRATWLDEHVDVFVDELSTLGLVIERPHVADLLRDRVAAVAAEIGVGERAARRYLSHEVVRDLAREVAMTFADEQPGADVIDGPRTIAMPTASVGRTIAALAEAAHLRAGIEDSVGVHGILQLISLLGQILSTAETLPGERVLLPQAALTRSARLLEATATMIRTGVTSEAALPASDMTSMADAFVCDATALRMLVGDHGTYGGTPDAM